MRFLLLSLLLLLPAPLAAEEPLRVLFLGDAGHHRPAERYAQLAPVFAPRGIELEYTERVSDLNPETLARYHALLVFANHGRIGPEEESALLAYVRGGGGFVPVHCASYCFLNSDAYVDLVGAQFQKHGTGVFRTAVSPVEHEVTRGYGGFTSWDETYAHHRHNEKNRTVLEYRVAEGEREPWTWVRTEGEGRVFYTAWGHDHRTWGHPGFHNLLERGVRWAARRDPAAAGEFTDQPAVTRPAEERAPFTYQPAEIPFYPGGSRWGTLGEPIREMQQPLAPAESLKRYVTPAGFEAKLFVSEPELGGKPICMAWDERGRLWIAETVDYPNELQPQGKGRDRIRICEDTNGDGRADRFTVFAEKLSIPTSLAFAHGGVLVHQAPHTLFLRDNTGDDVADERLALFTGWDTRDTHAGPSNLVYGHDNWYYGIVGYSGFEGEIAGKKRSFRTGLYRFRLEADPADTRERPAPRVVEFEFLRNLNNNCWGIGISEEGLLFASTANGNPSDYLAIPNRHYEGVRGWTSTVLSGIADSAEFHPVTDRVRQVDHHGRFTAAAGHALYTARTYPPYYWNQVAFVNGPTGHLTASFLLRREGAGFASRNSWNLLASDDEWSAPIVAEVGPDGQVWVIDWYNYIVQHNPTPAGFRTGRGNAYETELRDKRHGRVVRVVYTAGEESKVGSLAGAGTEELVAALASDNLLWRRHAQRLLVEGKVTAAVPFLLQLLGRGEVDRLGLNVGAIHSVHTLAGLGVLAEPGAARSAVEEALRHRAAGVRLAALTALPRDAAAVRAIVAADSLRDLDPQVQLAALLALSEAPADSAAGEYLAGWIANGAPLAEPHLADAAIAAAARHDHAVDSLLAAKSPPGQAVTRLLARVAEHQARGAEAEVVRRLLPRVAEAAPSAAEAVIGGWSAGWPAGSPLELSEGEEQALAKLIVRVPAATRGPLVKLAAAWGTKSLERHAEQVAAALEGEIGNEQLPAARRIAAAAQWVAFLPAADAPAGRILEFVTPQAEPQLARGLLLALAESRAEKVGAAVMQRLPGWTPALREEGVRLLLRRPEWTADLLAGLETGKLQLGELALDQKRLLAEHPDKGIAERARKLLAAGVGLPDPDRAKVIEQLHRVTEETGDPAPGKLVFAKHCAKCHVYGGEGGHVGPDLTGMAVHPKEELLTQILDPSRSVEGNFRAYTLVTAEGRVLTGLLAGETQAAVELIDAEANRQVVLREDIDELIASSKSLMPEGFEKQLTPEELTDLLEFLTQRGQYLPLPLAKAATVVSTRGMFYSEEAEAERLIFRDWSPKTFEGIPFVLVDPQGTRTPNVVMLHSVNGRIPPSMPKEVSLPVNAPARAIHLLGGVAGWGFPAIQEKSVSMVVRLHYADGATEDHELRNGVHVADYIRAVEVPESKLAFMLRGQQVRYLALKPKRSETIREIEFRKGEDRTAPIVMAVTVEP